jgi:hypothetical protein
MYRVEVEFKKLKEFELEDIALSCSTIKINGKWIDFCSTEVYDHEDTINVLMKEFDCEGINEEDISKYENILKNPSESDKIYPIISWMEFKGEELSDTEINEYLEYKELTYIPSPEEDAGGKDNSLYLDWVYKKKGDVHIGFIGAMTVFYIYHDVTEGDLFTPMKEVYRLSSNGLMAVKSENSGWLDYENKYNVSEDCNDLFEGTLEDCMNKAEELLRI